MACCSPFCRGDRPLADRTTEWCLCCAAASARTGEGSEAGLVDSPSRVPLRSSMAREVGGLASRCGVGVLWRRHGDFRCISGRDRGGRRAVRCVERYPVAPARRLAAIVARGLMAAAGALPLASADRRSLSARRVAARRAIATGWYALWVVVALLPMVGVLSPRVACVPLPLPNSSIPGYLLVLGALLPRHAWSPRRISSCTTTSTSWMASLPADASPHRRRPLPATRPAVIVISVALVAAYAIAIAYWLSAVEGLALFDKQPQTGFAALDYAAHRAPRAADRPAAWRCSIASPATTRRVVFSGTLVAQAYYFIVKGIGSSCSSAWSRSAVAGAWQLRRIVTELEDERRPAGRPDRARPSCAPPVDRARHPARGRHAASRRPAQKRLIVAAVEIGIFALAADVLRTRSSVRSRDLQSLRRSTVPRDVPQPDAGIRRRAERAGAVHRRGARASPRQARARADQEADAPDDLDRRHSRRTSSISRSAA